MAYAIMLWLHLLTATLVVLVESHPGVGRPSVSKVQGLAAHPKLANASSPPFDAPWLAKTLFHTVEPETPEGLEDIIERPGPVFAKYPLSASYSEASVETSQLYPPTSTIISPTATLAANSTESQALQSSYSSLEPSLGDPEATMAADNIFAKPIGVGPPPPMMKVQKDHPVPRTGIETQAPLQTNKFYANLFLSDQRAPVYTFPYSLAWAGGKGAASSWGMICSHIEAKQRVFGKEKATGASSYYINPVGIESLILSAKGLGNQTKVTIDSMTAYSARVHLSRDNKSPPAISFPLVQGMPFITAEYSDSVPLIQTGVFFKTVTKLTKNPKSDLSKFTFTLEDGAVWRLYAWKTKGAELEINVVNNERAESKQPFTGIIQLSKDPMTPGSEKLLDDAAGIYPVTLELSGSVDHRKGTYRFEYKKKGHEIGHLYMYALPHHVQSFDETTKGRVQDLQLQSTVKGLATLVKGDNWTMVEPEMPIGMNFSPWHPEKGSIKTLSERSKGLIKAAAAKELSQKMIAQANLDSMYFSGKALAKFALILFVVQDMLEDRELSQRGLGQLKAAFDIFAANKQKYPLMYENAWGGVVSSATYKTGNTGADFGNTLYNDHHFHYGYHILAAAIIAHLDPEWLPANKQYVNSLVRDVANPSEEDKYFPQWRNFDWYHGHSWAHGLYAAMDGKNQESSSEDMMHAYALKMWGKVVGDEKLEARSNLQLAILSRSLRHYYLYQKNNTVQPERFIGNKVAGILFENKVDHTTFFSPDIECIQGIHMIPLLAPTPFVRVPAFVQEEWEAFFSEGRIDEIRNAWKGIIYGSYATVEPKKAWEFFSSADFDPQWLDGGASLTWFMAYSAAMGQI